MLITVNRFLSDSKATLSTIYVGRRFICFGVEDPWQEDKIPGRTRIPGGLYKIIVRTWGGFHTRYSERFPALHKGMLEIANVPGFTDILIHIGNTPKDTEGCLLVGYGANADPGHLCVLSSTEAYKALYGEVIHQATIDNLHIRFIDSDL